MPKLGIFNIEINGIKTKYATFGKGKNLIILPAWRMDIDRSEELIKYIGVKFRVFYLNVPGYGNRNNLKKYYTVEDYSRFICSWIKKLDLDKFSIFGISMGGPIAYNLLNRIDEKKVDKVIFLAPWYNSDCLNFNPKLFKLGEKLIKVASTKKLSKIGDKIFDNKKLLMGYMRLITPKENFKDKENMIKYVKNFRTFSFTTTMYSLYNVLKYDLNEKTKKHNHKTIFVMSKNDPQISYDKTLKGYKRLFPNIIEFPLEHKFHAPRIWITKKLISQYFGKTFIEAMQII
ncbi:MAG: alpha/beta hydrolase [Nanoarchaeota archaeon]